MKIINYSAEPLSKLYSWLPRDIEGERVVFFPDACPGKSPLPTGTAVLIKNSGWRKFAVSDCGCGMRLLKSSLKWEEFNRNLWDQTGWDIQANKGNLGDLGGGNHFLDALVSYEDESIYFLIHTGSRLESGLVDKFVDSPGKFENEFLRVVQWAEENRKAIAHIVMKNFGKCKTILDLPHNSFEILEDGSVIIRKGAVRVKPGDLAVIPSSMTGDVVLVEATENVENALYSLSHGTGRTMPRSKAREFSRDYDFSKLRKAIYIPVYIQNSSLRTEAPYCYRSLNDCLSLLQDLVVEKERFAVIAYLGHL